MLAVWFFDKTKPKASFNSTFKNTLSVCKKRPTGLGENRSTNLVFNILTSVITACRNQMLFKVLLPVSLCTWNHLWRLCGDKALERIIIIIRFPQINTHDVPINSLQLHFGWMFCLLLSNWSTPPASNFISRSSFASTTANSSLPPPTKTILFAQSCLIHSN